MIETLWKLLVIVLANLPFVILVWIGSKTNVKRKDRSDQFLMPVLAFLYSTVLMFFVDEIGEKLINFINILPEAMERIPLLSGLSSVMAALVNAFPAALLAFYLLNMGLFIAHILLKCICIPFLKILCRKAPQLADEARKIAYEQDPINGVWLLKKNFAQGRTLIKVLYFTALGTSVVVARIAVGKYIRHDIGTLFYPALAIITLGELYYFINGLAEGEYHDELSGESDKSQRFCNYVPLRSVLRTLFPDKLSAENTTMGSSSLNVTEEGTGLYGRLRTGDTIEDAYYRFMYQKQLDGVSLDPGYLTSGLNLTKGKSVLFNNPFYYDLVPYAFYAMNRNLLCHKKILVILGRHGVEKDIEKWLDYGLTAVTNIPSLWSIGVLTDQEQDLDVGIITRSGVHELDMHTQNEEFFLNVGMVILVEPSKLITTAQIGLNSIVRRCRKKDITYCSTDKNCDGLVDALSHLLMTNITEVSATNRHEGTCSYMCWEPDSENLQHRLLPNISRYLGVGTELSFVALKNQVEQASWYGGEAFPVEDMHWIAKQYYFDLLRYANLPTNQERMDRCFLVSHNIWNESIKENGYYIVEDESCNMFEMKRAFATRATGQSFINIISPQYLFHDYMAMNDGMFNADPKAIPSIVADYAATQRNVALRLFLRMSMGDITVKELADELQLIGISGSDPVCSVWQMLNSFGKIKSKDDSEDEFSITFNGEEIPFKRTEVIQTVRRYSVRSGEMDDFVRITDKKFKDAILSDLKNARYISEEENGERKYIGSELIGHIFQKYLPGQFFTFEGKYYEMIRATPNGEIVLRRAADHITGRHSYRQIRNYSIRRIEESDEIGSRRAVNNMSIVHQYADICVETSGYWEVGSGKGFKRGKRVELNGIPSRTYMHKQILRVDFNREGEPASEKVYQTLAQLINEAFRTIFAENSDYIVAVCCGECKEPLTYSLFGSENFEPQKGSIYFIEDSQLDLGLLVAVERNLNRILESVCDYLEWNFEEIENSKKAPPLSPVIDFTEPSEEEEELQQNEEKKKPSWFGRLIDWFKNRRKKKAVDGKNDASDVKKVSERDDAESEDVVSALGDDSTTAESADETDADEETTEATNEEASQVMLVSRSAKETYYLASSAVEDMDGISGECSVIADNTEETAGERPKDSVEFETPETVSHTPIPAKRPYHERCYLFYGGTEVPESLDLETTLELLTSFGFAGKELSQARHGKNVAEQIERDFVPNLPGVHYCDFCGVELTGTEWDVLRDGRESCTNCSRSAIHSEDELKHIYQELIKNLEVFYGLHITAPIKVQMVNSEKLHKKIGMTFVPSAKPDARVLGVAIKDKKGNYTILIENGAPRVRSALTMVHELTHIWQYTNWDMAAIRQKYGTHELEVYEGLAKWSEIQYAYLIGESGIAKREEITTALRKDEYGRGFLKFAKKYPISPHTHVEGALPFDNKTEPL